MKKITPKNQENITESSFISKIKLKLNEYFVQIILFVFFLAGIVMFISSTVTIINTYQSRSWSTANGVILKNDIIAKEDSDGDESFLADIE